MRLIDADALVDFICMENCNHAYEELCPSCYPVEKIVEAPAVEAEPVKHGLWIRGVIQNGDRLHECSACRDECRVPTCVGKPIYDYCPNCGAKMDWNKKKGKLI